MFNVYVGYDSSRPYVNDVCIYSILNRTKGISVYKIGNTLLDPDIWWRKKGKDDSSEFSNSRFIIPYLNDYSGISIFMDDDFLCQCDIKELMTFYDDKYAVMVVKHNYKSKQTIKMNNVNQLNYEKKNWSSLMMFNNSHPDCKNLSLEYINKTAPLNLHQFKWSNNIGEIPIEYNHLVDEYENKDAKFYHFTLGGPWYDHYKNCSYADLWNLEYNKCFAPEN